MKSLELSFLTEFSGVVNKTDSEVKNFVSTVSFISHDEKFSTYNINNLGTTTSEITSALAIYKHSNPHIDTIGIYLQDDDKFYTSDGFLELNTFTDRVLQLDERQKEKFKNELNNCDTPIFYTDYNIENKDYVLYLSPMYGASRSQYTVVIFADKSMFGKISDSLVTKYNAGVYISALDYNKIKVVNKESIPLLSKEDLKSMGGVGVNGNLESIKINREKYKYITLYSEDMGLNITAMVKEKTFYRDFYENLFQIIFCTVFLLLFGFIAALIVSRKQYKPIMQIVNLIKNEDTPEKNEDDFMHIENAIETSRVHNEKLKKQLIGEALFTGMMLGENFSIESLSKSNLDFLNSWKRGYENFFVVLIASNEIGFNPADCNFEKIISEDESEYAFFALNLTHMVKHKYNSVFAIIIGSSDLDVNNYPDSFIEDSIQYNQKLDNCCIAVGRIYSIDRLKYSLLDALTALDYCSTVKNLVFFDEISSKDVKKSDYMYPFEKIAIFSQCIKQGNKEDALLFLNEVIEYAQNNNSNSNSKNFIKNSLLDKIVSLSIENEYTDIAKKAIELSEASGDHWQKKINELVLLCCDYMQEVKSDDEDATIENIKNYVIEHYDNFDLSLVSVAQHFGYSSSYISKIFKKNVGKSFSKFLSDIRMSKIKENLVQTDIAIKDIILNSGYSDVPNFSRKFKIETGLTPKKYRELYKK